MSLKSIATTALCLVAASQIASAGSYAPGCTKEPQSSWKTIDTSASKASALGYAISKTKLTGSCHEIYATKDGHRFELFFNPVTNDLVHTASK